MNYSADISIFDTKTDPVDDDKHKKIDIAFMYADVLVKIKKEKYSPLPTLSPEKMYE